ncbi:MAG: tetratricopeptide repeat protein [Elusimicrobiota bacterium]
MTTLFVIAWVSCLAMAAGAAPADEDDKPRGEGWQSESMEATSLLGELKYQQGDLAGAGAVFRESLKSSRHVYDPRAQVMGLDLYRTAELAVRRQEFAAARRHLEILVNRYPGSEWADKGKRLLDQLSARGEKEDDEEVTAVLTQDHPHFYLSRIQNDLKGGQFDAALSGSRDFLRRFPGHKAASELRLLEGALLLRQGRFADAVAVLRTLARGQTAAAVKAKAVYLLGAAEFLDGDSEGVQNDVPALRSIKGADRWLALAQVWRAAALQVVGRNEPAMSLFRQISESKIESPIKAYAWAALAAGWDRQGRPDRAVSSLSRTVDEASRWRLDDLAASARLSLAHVYYKTKRFVPAAAAYGEFAREHPDHPQWDMARYQEGLSFKRLGRAQKALAVFLDIARKGSGSTYAPDAHLQLGQLYTELGLSQKAIAHYQDMAAVGGVERRKESELLIAQVHYNNKRYKEAIPYYRHYLEQNPQEARAREVEDLLLTSYWMGDRKSPDLLKAVARYPDHPIVSHIRWEFAVEAYRERDYLKAVESLSRYDDDYPRSSHAADGLFYQAEAMRKLGDAQGAAQAYGRFISRFPGDSRARQAGFHRGAALYEAGDLEGSARAYARVEPGSDVLAADALYNQALSLSKANLPAEALAAYERLAARFPRYPKINWVWFQIATRREAEGKLPSALAAYVHVPAHDPNYPQALFSMARLHEKLKQVDLAIAGYRKLASAGRPPDNPLRLRGLARLGLLYELKGQAQQAVSIYEQVLHLAKGDSSDGVLARKRLGAILQAEHKERERSAILSPVTVKHSEGF